MGEIVSMSFIGFGENVTYRGDGFLYKIIDGDAVRLPYDYNGNLYELADE